MKKLVPINKHTKEVNSSQNGEISDQVIEQIFGVKPTPMSESDKAMADLAGPDALVYKVAGNKVEVILKRSKKYRLTKLNKDLVE